MKTRINRNIEKMNKMTGCLEEALESATFCPDSFAGHRATTIGAEFFLAHVVDDSAVLSGEMRRVESIEV